MRVLDKKIKPVIIDMALKNPALKTLIVRLGLEAENLRSYEYYTTGELEQMIETAQNLKQRQMSRRERKSKRETENKTHFPKGIAVFEPHKNAPDFVLANISINVEDFIEWVDSKEGKKFLKDDKKYGDTLNLQMNESKDGVPYLQINTFGTDMDDSEEEEEEEEETKTRSRRKK